MALEDDLNVTEAAEPLSAEDEQILKGDLDGLSKEEGQQKPESKTEVTTEEDDEPLGAEHDDKTDAEREVIRERRRQERQNKKKFRAEKEDSYKREIEGLRRQLEEVNEWKNTVETRRVHSGIAQIDKAIKDSTDAIEVAKQAIREATNTGNGDALVDAQELYYAARKRAEDLGRVRQQFTQRQAQPPQQNIDPRIANQAKSWMEGKEWYNPAGKDPDSRIALTVDNSLAEEGWDPRTPEYWEELDTRLKKYLPHRYNSAYNEGKREVSRPPTGGSSQTRGSASSSSFTLSPERVRAMKEAGYWDEPTKRQTMIKRYMEQDRNKS